VLKARKCLLCKGKWACRQFRLATQEDTSQVKSTTRLPQVEATADGGSSCRTLRRVVAGVDGRLGSARRVDEGRDRHPSGSTDASAGSHPSPPQRGRAATHRTAITARPPAAMHIEAKGAEKGLFI
jgi:hypothetical protein